MQLKITMVSKIQLSKDVNVHNTYSYAYVLIRMHTHFSAEIFDEGFQIIISKFHYFQMGMIEACIENSLLIHY